MALTHRMIALRLPSIAPGGRLAWLLLALFGVSLAVGGPAGMSPFYGLLIPFGFVQGPGQAATMGGIIEDAHAARRFIGAQLRAAFSAGKA